MIFLKNSQFVRSEIKNIKNPFKRICFESMTYTSQKHSFCSSYRFITKKLYNIVIDNSFIIHLTLLWNELKKQLVLI
jgi:hypothetical protein